MLGQLVGLEPPKQALGRGGLQMMIGASNHHRNEDGMGTSQKQSTHHIMAWAAATIAYLFFSLHLLGLDPLG